MNDRTSNKRKRRSMDEMRALLIPADPTKPVEEINLKGEGNTLDALQKAVGGWIEFQRHPNFEFVLNEEGRMIEGMEPNARVNHFLVNDSQWAGNPDLERAIVYGPAIVVGPADRNGAITPVSQETIDYFRGLEVSKDAQRDWDVRSLDVVITEWNLGEGRGLD